MGAAAAARAAIERIQGNGYEFVLHLDVDVIADFPATNYPKAGGLTLEEVREALLIFAQQKELAAIEVTAYNPAKDPDGSGAKMIIDLLAEALGERLEALKAPEAAVAAPPAAVAAVASQGAGGTSSKNAAPRPRQSRRRNLNCRRERRELPNRSRIRRVRRWIRIRRMTTPMNRPRPKNRAAPIRSLQYSCNRRLTRLRFTPGSREHFPP